ncbi:hypothetical protein Dsin_031908 [Dipteronia sinensis]|uniref:Late embryogenesis abundant protein LEA-2 subgroup domain-containing protein n=1 Tax=Dipteronia sinensis TaxID=43782 RepID=A0AAE0DST7_9ROSI|nr:hypothetical protein Dsin_031908 [Dipteronia sinensis]
MADVKVQQKPEKPVTVSHLSPPPGTYIIKLPTNQIFRVPTPENALRFEQLSRRNKKYSGCCLCFIVLNFFFLFMVSAAVISYFVIRPKSPNYSINNVSIKSFNLTATVTFPSLPPHVSPEFDLTFTAVNPNNKIGIHYEKGSSVQVFYKNVNLFDGVLPQLFQPSKNVTVFKSALEGNSAMAEMITSSVHDELVAAEKTGTVPLMVIVRAPVKFKLDSVKTWTMNVKVRCDVTVDKLTAKSKIQSKNCHYGVNFW